MTPDQYGGIVAAQAAANQASPLTPPPEAPVTPDLAPPPVTTAPAGPQFSPDDEQQLADLTQRREDAKKAATAAARAQAMQSAPVPGSVVVYRYHDHYAEPARERDQLVVVTEVTADGNVRGLPIGFADQSAEFTPGMLTPLL